MTGAALAAVITVASFVPASAGAWRDLPVVLAALAVAAASMRSRYGVGGRQGMGELCRHILVAAAAGGGFVAGTRWARRRRAG